MGENVRERAQARQPGRGGELGVEEAAQQLALMPQHDRPVGLELMQLFRLVQCSPLGAEPATSDDHIMLNRRANG